MVDFVHELEVSDQNYHTNVSVWDGNYNEKFLFTINYFVSFANDHQSIYFM